MERLVQLKKIRILFGRAATPSPTPHGTSLRPHRISLLLTPPMSPAQGAQAMQASEEMLANPGKADWRAGPGMVAMTTPTHRPQLC